MVPKTLHETGPFPHMGNDLLNCCGTTQGYSCWITKILSKCTVLVKTWCNQSIITMQKTYMLDNIKADRNGWHPFCLDIYCDCSFHHSPQGNVFISN